jgi:type II secretory pathway pseudopilin PulG
LVECLVAITLLGSLLGTVTLTLGVMYRADRNLRDAVDQERALDQFTARFRTDAHQALSASVSKPAEAKDSARELVLKSSADQTIQYTLRPQDVERVVRRGESIVHRETYGVTATAAGWQIRGDRKPTVVSVSFERQAARGGDGQTPLDAVRIDAVVCLVRTPP